MLTEESYRLAWLVYSAASAGLLLSLWPFLRRFGGPTRLTVLLLCCVLVMLPARPEETAETFAPAVVVAGFDLLTHGPEAAAVSARPLAILAAGAFVPGLGWALIRRLRRRKSA